jgi:hypothetical protein
MGRGRNTPLGPAPFLSCILYWAAAAAVALAPVSPLVRPARAILQTGSQGVYQTADGHLKIIVSSQEGSQGLFIVYMQEGVAPQEFDAEKISPDGVSHMFLRFDPSSEHPYSEVIVGGKGYKVGGNFTLTVGEKNRLFIDADNTSSYLTITYRSDESKEESMIGFYGITEVIKGSGNFTLLRANQLDAALQKVIKPYKLDDGKLLIGKKAISTQRIGTYVKREHPCLNAGIPTLTREQLQQIQAAKGGESEQARLLSSLLAKNGKEPPTRGMIAIKTNKSEPMILLDVLKTHEKNVMELKPIKSGTRTLCVLSPAG